MMTALVFGHHPFPSPTATAQLDGIRSDLTTIFSQFLLFVSGSFGNFLPLACLLPGTNPASSGRKIRSCCSAARWLVDAMQAAYLACRCYL
jgi:hypothetical protein